MRATDGQSFFDVAIIGCGSAGAALSLAIKNGLSVTDTLAPGQPLALTEAVNPRVVDYFATRGIDIATAFGDLLTNPAPTVVVTVVGSTVFVGDAVKAVDNQSLFDIAVERLGSAEAALAIAIKNGRSITDQLGAGEAVYLTGMVNQDIADYYSQKAIKPCFGTNVDNSGDELAQEGIGYWAIGIDFVIS